MALPATKEEWVALIKGALSDEIATVVWADVTLQYNILIEEEEAKIVALTAQKAALQAQIDAIDADIVAAAATKAAWENDRDNAQQN